MENVKIIKSLLLICMFSFLSIVHGQVISSKSAISKLSAIEEGFPEISITNYNQSQDNVRNGFLIIDENEYKIEGSIRGGNPIVTLTINDKKIPLLSDSNFSVSLPIILGENKFEIEAKDIAGKHSKYFLYVNRVVKEKRVALIIGNASYENAARLKNTINDAESMAECLMELNFEVFKYVDLDYDGMRLALRDFGDKAERADVIWVYYAGHGLQIDNVNYLIPVDAIMKNKRDVQYEALSVQQILNTLEENVTEGLNIMVLDACRNNPFKEWTRGGEVGLAKVEVPTGTLVAFSTSPNSYASDGEGDNGLYTGELIKQMQKPQRIVDIFINTRNAVETLSGKNQSPWEAFRLRGEFYLRRK